MNSSGGENESSKLSPKKSKSMEKLHRNRPLLLLEHSENMITRKRAMDPKG